MRPPTGSPASDAGARGLAAIHARLSDAVRQVAATEPDPLNPFRGLYVSDEAALALADELDAGEADERLVAAARALGLDGLETAILALCAAPYLDAGCGRLLAYLHDDVTRRAPTPRLVARLLRGGPVTEADVLARLEEGGALRRSGAVTLAAEEAVPPADRALALDERLAGRLLGADLVGASAAGRERLVAPAEVGRPEAVARIHGALAVQAAGVPLLVHGADAPDVLAAALARPLLVLDARDAPDPAHLASARVRAALEGAALALELPAAPPPEEAARIAAAVAGGAARLLCAGRREAAAVLDGVDAFAVEVPPPALGERTGAWRRHAGGEVDGVAAKFSLTPAQIERAAVLARVAAGARGASAPAPEDLEHGARVVSRTNLGELATLLEPRWGWDDLVLPPAQTARLRSVAAYLRHRDLVLGEWGFGRAAPGQGLKVLFAGESGTGKTMAAQVIAGDLGLDVFRVDLAGVVSKYIGETERNLERIFAAAEGSNAILFFDEADALFGRRSEVKDAHDRYANIEVAYLLQRMEVYPGAVVLATNYRRNIDEAFLRRLDVAVDFPSPGREDRARLWRRLLPDAAPVAHDVDPDALAERFELAGGAIRNCSVGAAFAAAADGGVIRMEHLVAAVEHEYRKAGRLTFETQLAGPNGASR